MVMMMFLCLHLGCRSQFGGGIFVPFSCVECLQGEEITWVFSLFLLITLLLLAAGAPDQIK